MAGKPVGKEAKQVCSVRLEPQAKKDLIKVYGSIQKAIDTLVIALGVVKKVRGKKL